MEITAVNIQKNNKNKCNIFIDGEYKFSASLSIVIKHKIKVGNILSQTGLDEILNEESFEQALTLSLRYISKALKTKRQIYNYLIKKSFSPDCAYKVIDRLKELNYINDVEYAKRYAEYSFKKEGKRLTDFKLMQKGIKKTDIEAARDNLNVDTMQTAKMLAEKRLKNKEITKELLAKTFRYLVSKGFSYEEVENAIKTYGED